MYRRAFVALAALIPLTLPALATEDATPKTVQVNAAQIEELLSGNTITGTWSGSNYRQHYYQNGRTIYVPEGGQPSEGKWRTNAETNQYDSWWEQTGWTPYTVVMTNDGFAWVNGDKLEPFKVFEGKQGEF